MGVTGAQSTVDPTALEAAVRDVLNLTAPRFMVVLEPIKLTIKNFSQHDFIELDVLDFPNEVEKGQHKIKFNEIVYIEASDFKEVRSVYSVFKNEFYYSLILFAYHVSDRGERFSTFDTETICRFEVCRCCSDIRKYRKR